MRLQSIGTGDDLVRPEADPEYCLEGERMEVRHDGFTIEYVNNTEGMRQNFIVDRQFDAEGALKVELSCESDLEMTRKGAGDVLFSSLHPVTGAMNSEALNADGKALHAWMETGDKTLALMVEDDDAYPITIDPLSTTAY